MKYKNHIKIYGESLNDRRMDRIEMILSGIKSYKFSESYLYEENNLTYIVIKFESNDEILSRELYNLLIEEFKSVEYKYQECELEYISEYHQLLFLMLNK